MGDCGDEFEHAAPRPHRGGVPQVAVCRVLFVLYNLVTDRQRSREGGRSSGKHSATAELARSLSVKNWTK
jgi:hypothetical protein